MIPAGFFLRAFFVCAIFHLLYLPLEFIWLCIERYRLFFYLKIISNHFNSAFAEIFSKKMKKVSALFYVFVPIRKVGGINPPRTLKTEYAAFQFISVWVEQRRFWREDLFYSERSTEIGNRPVVWSDCQETQTGIMILPSSHVHDTWAAR